MLGLFNSGSLVLAHAEGPVPDDYYDNVSAKKYDDSIGPIIMCINMSICKPNPEPFKNLLGPYGPLPGIQVRSSTSRRDSCVTMYHRFSKLLLLFAE